MKSPQEIRELILYLLDLKKSSSHKMLTECGYNTSLVNDLKKGQMPAADKIATIANYLGVSTDYLLGNGGNKKNDEDNNKNNKQEDSGNSMNIAEAQTLINEGFIRDLRAAFYGDKIKELTDEDKEHMIEMAKVLAKVRTGFTPKKSEVRAAKNNRE